MTIETVTTDYSNILLPCYDSFQWNSDCRDCSSIGWEFDETVESVEIGKTGEIGNTVEDHEIGRTGETVQDIGWECKSLLFGETVEDFETVETVQDIGTLQYLETVETVQGIGTVQYPETVETGEDIEDGKNVESLLDVWTVQYLETVQDIGTVRYLEIVETGEVVVPLDTQMRILVPNLWQSWTATLTTSDHC